MTNPEVESGDVFQIENFRRLVELMKANEINEVDIRKGGQRIRLRRGGAYQAAPAVVYEAPRPVAAASHAPAPAAAASAPAAAPAAPAADDSKFVVIKCQTVGTFYTSSAPDAPPYVKVGDQVGPDTVVCMIEAMKVFNEIPAETSGKIVGVLAQNGHPVEFGQPLFKIDPRG